MNTHTTNNDEGCGSAYRRGHPRPRRRPGRGRPLGSATPSAAGPADTRLTRPEPRMVITDEQPDAIAARYERFARHEARG
jgi:hypothetical protein